MPKIWNADELMAMTPAEREALFVSQSTDDLDDVPPALLESARAKVRSHINRTGTTAANEA